MNLKDFLSAVLKANAETNENIIRNKPAVDRKPEQENIEDKINSIDSINENPLIGVRDFAVDLGTGAAIGAGLSALKGKHDINALQDYAKNSSKQEIEKNPYHAGNLMLSEQMNGITVDSKGKNKKLQKTMTENVQAAKDLQDGKITQEQALKIITKNFKLETAIGPDWKNDIYFILKADTGKSDREIDKIVKNWVKKNGTNPDLAKLIEAKDPKTTWKHSLRVAKIAEQIALDSGMSPEEAAKLRDACLLHDIGKIGVADRALSSSDNFKQSQSGRDAQINKHTEIGKEILKDKPYEATIAEEHHNAKRGLPYSMEDSDIASVADIYEALTTEDRIYKDAKPADLAIKITDDETKGSKYIENLRKLNDEGILEAYDPEDSELADAYNAMKANALKRNLYKNYALTGAQAGGVAGTYFHLNNMSRLNELDKGGLGTQNSLDVIPTPSEILTEAIPLYRSKKEKLEDIKNWYNMGLLNEDQINKITNTDFSSNLAVTKLWKELNKSIK